MTQNMQWWPVALAGEIAAGKPVAVHIDGEPVVLFRDEAGAARALEDRCPHRRAPLSLGKVTADGLLQCGYHGWSFDGASGQCKRIPNLRPDEPVPAGYGVFSYRAAELHGLVYITNGTQPLPLPDAPFRPQGRVFAGRSMVGLGQRDYIAALMDAPHLLLDCAGLRVARTMIADPQMDNGFLVMERAAFWTGQPAFDGFVREYKLLFRLAVAPETGESWLSFARPDNKMAAAAHFGVTPAARGITAILWQSFTMPAPGARPSLLRALAGLGRAPIAPRNTIDMAALAKVIIGPSDQLPRIERAPGLYGERLTRERART